MAYVTTSRKAGPVTRRLARSLSTLFKSRYVTRGKTGFNSVLASAESLGHTRVVFIHERHGNPYEIRAIEIGPDQTYDEVGYFVFNPVIVKRIGRLSSYLVCNKQGERFARLFLTKSDLESLTAEGRVAVNVLGEDDFIRISVSGEDVVVLKKVQVH